MLMTSIKCVNPLLECTSKTVFFPLVLVWELTPEVCTTMLGAPCICHLAILHTSVTIINNSWCHETYVKTLFLRSVLLM
jgi:hypothetical protein